MKETSYEDLKGRMHAVSLPDGVPDSEASLGIPIGPPSLAALELPEATEIALHNQLFARRIFTLEDAKHHRQDVMSALQAALKLDVERVLEVYLIPSNIDNEPKGKPQKRGV